MSGLRSRAERSGKGRRELKTGALIPSKYIMQQNGWSATHE
jgi:hypothetical protein